MSNDIKIYRFSAVDAFLDLLKIEDWWEGDDAIQVEPNADDASVSVGAGGSALLSMSSNESVNIILKLQVQSAAHKFLTNQRTLFKQGGVFVPFRFSVVDTINGENGFALQCATLKKPKQVHGENASVREWTLFGAKWVETPIV